MLRVLPLKIEENSHGCIFNTQDNSDTNREHLSLLNAMEKQISRSVLVQIWNSGTTAYEP